MSPDLLSLIEALIDAPVFWFAIVAFVSVLVGFAAGVPVGRDCEARDQWQRDILAANERRQQREWMTW